MRTPYLLHVPKTAPTKRHRFRTFKAEHGIFTHDCGHKDYECRWSACLLKTCFEHFRGYCRGEAKEGMRDADLFFVLIQHACRLMDESSLLISAPTEMQAVRILCKENNIKFRF